MKTSELVDVVVRRYAMTTTANVALPRAPSFCERAARPQGSMPSLLSRTTAPVPEFERTRPEAVTHLKTLAPPAI